jgi:PPOX class probable F420-dependent enzyme
MTGPSAYFAALDRQQYLNLETTRRDGRDVRTPVWFAADPVGATLYVYTLAASGKAKRIRHTAAVRVAPCDSRGRVTGDWIAARASIVGGDGFGHGMGLIDRKYRPWKQLLDLTVLLFRRRQRVVIAIEPVTSQAAG